MNRGLFVCLEGPDKAGKTTQRGLIGSQLAADGVPHLLTSEPTKLSAPGKRAREIIQSGEPFDPLELQKLFVEDRRWHLKHHIEPAIAEGKVVLTDRFLHSTIVYGSSERVTVSTLEELNKEFRHPDLTCIIWASPATCMSRIKSQPGAAEKFENEKAVEYACRMYRDIIPVMYPNSRIEIVDGEREEEFVTRDIYRRILTLLDTGVRSANG